jgi:hypothetical protein
VSEKNITNRGPKKRDPACFELQHAILVPKGTILRQEPGKPGVFTCPVAFGVFTVTDEAAQAHPDTYKRVIA